MANLNSA